MNIYPNNRILDNSYFSNTSSVRSSYGKNNGNYHPLNSNLKKNNLSNTFSNLNMNLNTNQNSILNSNSITTNYNPLYRSINTINSKYTNSEPNIINDKRYNNIKATSKNLQSRLDKLISHSKEKNLEIERNKTLRNQYYNRPLSTQRMSSSQIFDNYNNILQTNEPVISGYKNINKSVYNEYSSFKKNNTDLKNFSNTNKISRNNDRKLFNSLQKNSNTLKNQVQYDNRRNYFNEIPSQENNLSFIQEKINKQELNRLNTDYLSPSNRQFLDNLKKSPLSHENNSINLSNNNTTFNSNMLNNNTPNNNTFNNNINNSFNSYNLNNNTLNNNKGFNSDNMSFNNTLQYKKLYNNNNNNHSFSNINFNNTFNNNNLNSNIYNNTNYINKSLSNNNLNNSLNNNNMNLSQNNKKLNDFDDEKENINDLSYLAEEFVEAFNLNKKVFPVFPTENKNLNIKEEDKAKMEEYKKLQENLKFIKETMENLTRETQKLEKLEEENKLEEAKELYKYSPHIKKNYKKDDYEITNNEYNLSNELDILKSNYDSDSNFYFKDDKLNINELIDEDIKNKSDLLDLKRQLAENSKKNSDNLSKKNEKEFNPVQSVISEVSENKEVSVYNENEVSSKNPFQNSNNNIQSNQDSKQDDLNNLKKKQKNFIEETNLLKENLKDKNDKKQIKNPFEVNNEKK